MTKALIGGAIGGSKGGGKARTPIYAADTVRSRGIVEIVEEWCWGEIAGFPKDNPLKCVKLDGTPVMDDAGTVLIPGVTFDYRLGTQDQTYIPGTVEDAIGAPVAVNVNVTYGNPVIRTINDTTTDAVRVVLTFQGLYRQDPTKGDRTGTSVQVAIDVRPNSTGPWLPANLQGRGTINDKQDGAYQRAFVINLRDFDELATVFDVRVTRLSADPDSNTVNAFKFDTYVKLTYAKLRRPNIAHCRLTFDTRYFSSIPQRSYDLLGWLCWVPHALVYNPATRAYTGADWDGTLVRAYTRNPAWFLYTLLLTEGHGLGDYIEPAYQDKWLIYKIAQRCDQLVSDGRGGQEFRYSIDAWISEGVTAHEMITQIAGVFDSQALWDGSQVYLTQDAPKPITNLYLPANVVGGQFVYAGSGRQVRYTAAEIKYNDPSDQGRLASEYIEDVAGIERYGFNLKQETRLGCTSRSEANRAGRRLLITSRMETDSVVFSPTMAAFRDKPGDIIRTADPKRQQGKRLGGRVSVGSTASAVVLDAPVVLAAGITYRLAVIDSDGSVMDGSISNAAGTHGTITVSPAFSEAPTHEMEWIVYDPDAIGQTWRIVSIDENDDLTKGAYTISAVQYNPDKYDQIDSVGSLEDRQDNPYTNATSVAPPSGLIVNDGVYMALEGMRRYLDIAWSKSTDPFLKAYALVVRHEGVTIFDDEIDSQSKRILNPTVGDYEITLAAVSILGRFSSSITVSYALGELYPIESVSITDLALKTGGTSFAGKSVELVWADDALSVLGYSDAYGSGNGGQSPWFRDFQIDVYDGPAYANYLLVGGSISPLRSDFVTEYHYNYTYDKNTEDAGPRRALAFIVRARDAFGRYSIADTLQVSNPQPAAILAGNVEINHGYQSVVVSYLRPADNDWVGVIVFMSTTSGFTPNRAVNQVFIGSDTSITITGLTEGTTYYFRIAAYDAFYDINGTGTDYTLTTTEFTATVNSVSAAMTPAEIKSGLQTALDVAVDPLVFNADAFAVNLLGVDKTPFIIGMLDGSPAILLDADVGITGTLSASQIVSGTIGATEAIAIGNGNAVINGNGSIVVYDGPSTETNRDFAMLSAGTLTFQRYRGGAYHEYKSVRRVEYGQANSGDTVTLPGYWDAQPRLIISPASLCSFYADQAESSQTWTIRAENLSETTPGSGVWEFDAIAELNYADSSGSRTVASSSGAVSVDSWTSAEDILPTNTASITVTAQFSSIRGNGTSTYGYYYRTVAWTVQGWNGSVWTDLETKSRNITAAEHGQQITDTNAITIAAGISKIRVVYLASDTNGTQYSLGANITQRNLYWDAFYSVDSVENLPNGTIKKTTNQPIYNPPAGWGIYAQEHIIAVYSGWEGTIGPSLFLKYDNNRFFASYPLNSGYIQNINLGVFNCSSIGPDFLYTIAYAPNGGVQAWGKSYAYIFQKNSQTPSNAFTLQSYAWNITGSTAIATGSLNWTAIGD